MARHRLARMLATAALVGATSLGLVVSTAGTSQALDVGPADRLAIKVLTDGFMKGGVRAATPGLMARLESRCLSSGPMILGCSAGVAGLGVGLWYATDKADVWVPWLVNKAAEMTTTGSTVQNACASSAFAPAVQAKIDAGTPLVVSDLITGTAWSATWVSSGGDTAPCYVSANVSTTCLVNGVESSRTGVTGANGVNAGTPFNQNFSGKFGTGCIGSSPVTYIEVVPTPFSAGGTVSEGYLNGLLYRSAQPSGTGDTTSRVQCRRPDGTSYEVNRSSLPEPGTQNVRVATCDPGDTPYGMTVSQNGTNAAPSTSVDLSSPVSDYFNYPKCVTAAGDDKGCYYRVLVDDLPCTPGSYDCVHWRRLSQTQPTRFDCMWGPYSLPLDACRFMERAYTLTTGSTTVTKKNTDGDPLTWDPPDPDPAWDPNRPTPTPTPAPTATPQVTVTEAPQPSPTVTVRGNPEGCQAAEVYHLGPVQAVTAAGVANLAPRFGITTVGGWRESDPISQDHPSGLAADFMLNGGVTQADYLSEYAKNNAAMLGIQYIISQQHIWNVDRASEGWRLMPDRGSPTANHMDHVHITFKATASAGPCSTDPGDNPEVQEGCFASSTTLLDPGTWVIGPLKCLFIPRKPLGPRTSELTTKIATHGPGPIFTAIQARFGDFGNAGGCLGPEVRFHVSTVDQTLHPFSACDEPIKTVASYAKALTTVMISLTGALALARAIAAGFGFNLTMGRPGGGESA